LNLGERDVERDGILEKHSSGSNGTLDVEPERRIKPSIRQSLGTSNWKTLEELLGSNSSRIRSSRQRPLQRGRTFISPAGIIPTTRCARNARTDHRCLVNASWLMFGSELVMRGCWAGGYSQHEIVRRWSLATQRLNLLDRVADLRGQTRRRDRRRSTLRIHR
jgi:hypothetical protein